MGDSPILDQRVERRDSDYLPNSQYRLYSNSSDESLPLEAPLARQTRCSIDIDTIEPTAKPTLKNGINERENAYLDSMQLSDSTQEIS